MLTIIPILVVKKVVEVREAGGMEEETGVEVKVEDLEVELEGVKVVEKEGVKVVVLVVEMEVGMEEVKVVD